MTDTPASTNTYVVQSTNRVELIQRDWDTLVSEGRVTAFQTPHWLRPWYAIVAPFMRAQPLFVSVRDAKSGAPLMLLMLCIRRQGMLRVIEFADGGLTDYNAPLLARNFSPNQSEMKTLWREILEKLPPAERKPLIQVLATPSWPRPARSSAGKRKDRPRSRWSWVRDGGG